MAGIVIAGALGQLGRALAHRLAAGSPIALDRRSLDVTDPSAVDRKIDELEPDVLINATAFNLVDDAESRPEEAYRTNALGPWALARAAARHGTLFVHFSTDYVFAGDARRPYSEADIPSPRSVYAASKLAGERLASLASRHMVLRTCGLYGELGGGGKGRNFVDTMLRLASERRPIRVVDDQRLSPSSAADVAAKAVELVERWLESRSTDLLGLHHVTNAGDCSWFELAREALRLAGSDVTVQPISTIEYGVRAPRPAYSVLARGHLARLGLDDMRPWNEALADYVRGRVGSRSGFFNR